MITLRVIIVKRYYCIGQRSHLWRDPHGSIKLRFFECFGFLKSNDRVASALIRV